MKDLETEKMALWLNEKLSEILGIPVEYIDPNEEFSNYGLTSISSACLMGELEKWLNRPLQPTLPFEHPTVALLSRYLADGSKEV